MCRERPSEEMKYTKLSQCKICRTISLNMGLNDNETNKTFPWHKWILNILLTAEEVFKHVLKNFMCYFISVSSNVVCVIHRCVHVKFALSAKINI